MTSPADARAKRCPSSGGQGLRAAAWQVLLLAVVAGVAAFLVTTLFDHLAARRVATSFEYLLRPRWSFLVEWPVLHQINGAMICISGILLLLPLPIPFSNLLPAITIISLAAAMMERDGYFVVLGTIAFLGNIVFFGAIAVGGYAAGYAAIDFLMEYFKGIPAESFPGD